jgi:hypothetical protein
MWLDDVFLEIGNYLGMFYEVDKSYCNSRYTGMAQILVGMDLTKGVANSITIKRVYEIVYQTFE